MNRDELIQLIGENRDKVNFGNFGNGVSNHWIEKAEERLKIKFPPSYIWWLKNYGGGEINGDEVFSIYELDFDSVIGGDIVYVNELNRKNGFTSNKELTIQENDQGESYYLKLDEVSEEGEYPVYLNVNENKYAENFLDFLKKKF